MYLKRWYYTHTYVVYRYCQNGFECDGGVCYDISWLCDDIADCTDGADEANCCKLIHQQSYFRF